MNVHGHQNKDTFAKPKDNKTSVGAKHVMANRGRPETMDGYGIGARAPTNPRKNINIMTSCTQNLKLSMVRKLLEKNGTGRSMEAHFSNKTR